MILSLCTGISFQLLKIKDTINTETAKEIARTLGRSEVAVFTKIRDLRKNEKIDYKPRGGHPNFRIVLKL